MSRYNKKKAARLARREKQFDGPTLQFSTEFVARAYYGHVTDFHPPVPIATAGRSIPIAVASDSFNDVVVGEIFTAVEKQHLYGDGIAVVD